MEIKLHDRVKLDDGRTGSIVHDDGPGNYRRYPFFCLTEDGKFTSLSQDDGRVTEIIGHRYFVDTPFAIGETYDIKGGDHKETVVGVGLLCKNEYGYHVTRNPDGLHPDNLTWPLTLPAKPEPSCEGKTVEIDGKKYRLSLVEE